MENKQLPLLKISVLSLFCLLIFAGSYAQPGFTSADMPNVGDQDTVMYLVYYPLTNQLDSETGNGYTWDFTTLPFSMYPNFKTLDYYRVKAHFVSQSFPDASIEEFVDDGTAGDVNLYSYRNDTLFAHRLGAVVSGLNLIPPMPVVAFPIQFNQSSVMHHLFHQAIYTTGERTTTTTYDGFGTLKMPGNRTFTNVFRIKKVEKDSSYITNSSITYTSYIWYKQGGQVPLLRLAWTGSTNLYFVFGSKAKNTSSGINEFDTEFNSDIFPNPSNGKFEISNAGLIPDKIQVYNMIGEIVFQGKYIRQIDISGSPKGIYLVNILNGTKTISKKIVLN